MDVETLLRELNSGPSSLRHLDAHTLNLLGCCLNRVRTETRRLADSNHRDVQLVNFGGSAERGATKERSSSRDNAD